MSENTYTEWWEGEDKQARGVQAYQAARHLQTTQGYRRDAALRHHQLWRQASAGAFVPGGGRSRIAGGTLSLNVVKAAISTIHSRVCKEQERVMFTTDQGDYIQREQAKIHTRFADGVSYAARLKTAQDRATLDALVFGSGIVKRFTRAGKFCAKRVFPGALYVNDVSGATEPEEKYEFVLMTRRALKALYPENAKMIDDAPSPSNDETEWYVTGMDHYAHDDVLSSQVMVVQAWLEPSYPGADDGRFMVCIQDGALDEGEWNEPAPYSKLDWQEGTSEYWGHGVAEELMGIQLEINRLIRKAQTSIDVVANPYIFTDKNSGLSQSHWTNIPGTFLEYSGREPKVVTPTALNPEVYNHMDRLYNRAFELIGTPMMNVGGGAVAGLESGRAMLVQQDVSTMRYASFEGRRNEWHRDTVFGFIREAKRNPEVSTKAVGKDYLEIIKGADLDESEDAFKVRAWPVSILPQQPAGKLQGMEHLANLYATSGVQLPPEYLASQINDPDLEAMSGKLTANVRLADKLVHRMLVDGESADWDPHMDPVFFINHFRMAYTEGLADGVPEASMDLLRDAIDMAVAMQAKAEAEMAQQNEAAMAGEQGNV